MKTLYNSIQEKLILNKEKTVQKKYYPKTKVELKKCIEEICGGDHDMEYINLSNIDVSGIVNMARLFSDYNFKEINLSGWHMENVKNITYMFSSKSIKKINISNWTKIGADRLENMFIDCENLEEIKGIEYLDVSNVYSFSNMFVRCNKLKTLDLSKWHPKEPAYFSTMFNDCANLESIGDVTHWKLDKRNGDKIIFNCPKFSNEEINKLYHRGFR